MTEVKHDKLNPIIKLTMLVLFAILVLLISSVFYIIVILAIVLSAKIVFNARSVFTKGIFGFALMIFLAQLLLVNAGPVIFEYWIISITSGGLENGILITGKFLSIIMMSWIFVATTRPSELSSALTSAGVPYRYSFLLVLSMRFVPVFQQELSAVREAQEMRGLRIGNRLRGVIRSIRYTTLPMLFSALSRVNTLAASMEGRGFDANAKKTFLHPLKMTGMDIVVGALAVIFVLEVYLISKSVVIF